MFKIKILIGILFLSFQLTAQTKEEAMLDEAVTEYEANHKVEAAKLLSEVIGKYPNYPRSYFVKARWEMLAKNYEDAVNSLLKLNELKPDFNPLQKKMLAESYFNVKNYTQAKLLFQEFINLGNVNPESKKICESMIQNIDFITNQPIEDYKITYENVGEGINTIENEYFPSTTADESMIYFTRNTRGNEDIWVSSSQNNIWNIAKLVDEPLIEGDNTYVSINSDVNDGAHTISPSGKHLFFTSCNRPNSFGSCDLFVAKKNGNEWGKPRMLPKNINTKAWETQPCISADGKTIYFVSNKEGGSGRGDIYSTQLNKDGTFSEPQNLGSEINTPGSEDKPFLHPDGTTLYFTSDGHPGYGGRDIFVSRWVDNKWTKPINLGGQINSEGDESSIFVNTLGTKAYISKENNEGGRRDQDIYSFKLPEAFMPRKVTYIKGLVLNARTNQPLKASVKIQNIDRGESTLSINSDEKNGDFLVTLVEDQEYGFNVLKEGFALYSKNYSFTKSASNSNTQVLEIKLEPLESGTKFELRNVFFETGKFDLKESSHNELNYIVEILTKNPTIKIQVSGHTDNVGQVANNQLLSENRAKSVMEFLISKGITADRLQYKGYGSSKPLSSNDTEGGRAQNRRTEIEIL